MNDLSTKVKIEEFSNCFFDLTTAIDVKLPNLPFDIFYIKVKHVDLPVLLQQTIHPNVEEITLEITDINIGSQVPINEIIKKINAKRVVLSMIIHNKEQLKDYKNGLFAFINKVDIDNLSVDFYFNYDERQGWPHIADILNHYKNIKHFSIYFDNDRLRGMMVPPKIGEFKRYHQHMWALDNYHSSFQLTCQITKNYLGIGDQAMSRLGKKTYSCDLSKDKKEWTLKEVEEFEDNFIEINDHVDRFAFYYRLLPEEFDEKYKLVGPDEYERAMKQYQNDIYSVHEYFIARLIEEISKC